MFIALIICTSLVCLWTWSENLKVLQNIYLGKYRSYFVQLMPLVLAFALLSMDWMIIAGSGMITFILSQWLKQDKLQFYSKWFCVIAVWVIGFQFLLQRFSGISQAIEPEMWVFWLGETGWQGVALGFVVGFLAQIVFRQSGHVWWLSPVLILSGTGSLGLVWGMFLGDRWLPKKHLSTIFSLVGFAVGIFLMGSYYPGLKWEYWFAACLVWISLETMIFNRQAQV